MKKSAFADIFYKSSGYVAVILISLCYVLSSLILISRTGKSVYEIISSGIISMAVGSLINGIFRGIGISRGEENEKILCTAREHALAVESVLPHIDRLGEYCELENKRALSLARGKILAREGMKYSDFFDSDGVAKPFCEYKGDEWREKRKSNRQRRAYNRARLLKIKPLTPYKLTSDGGNENDPFNFGTSKKKYRTHKNASDILTRVALAIIFGYFGASLCSEINAAVLIWNTLQIVLYIGSGILQMYNSYMWIVDDYRQGIIKKIDILKAFSLYVTNN